MGDILLWSSHYPSTLVLDKYGYGSIPINTIFRGMNIHLPAILMWTTGVQGFDPLPYKSLWLAKSPFFLGSSTRVTWFFASPQSSSLRRGFFSKRTRWGYPNSWMVYSGKSLLKMKDMDMKYVGYPWYAYYGTIIWWISLWTSYFLIISHIISYPYDKRTSDLGFGKSWFRIPEFSSKS